MREVCWRGFSTEDNEWYYGDLLQTEDVYFIVSIYSGNKIVDKNSLGQFTGLKDLKGRDLYENDIVMIHGYSSLTKSKIVWSEYEGLFGLFYAGFYGIKPLNDFKNQFFDDRLDLILLGNSYKSHT